MTCIYKIWMCCNIWLMFSIYYMHVLFIHTMHLHNIEGKKFLWYFLCMTCIYKIWMCCNILVNIFYLWHLCLYILFRVFFIYKTLRLRSIFDILFFMYDMYLQDLDTLQYFVKYSCILYWVFLSITCIYKILRLTSIFGTFYFMYDMYLQNLDVWQYFG